MSPADAPPPAIPETLEPPFTAWHHILIQCLQTLIEPAWLTILPFPKLGSIPLEADLLLLLKELDGPALASLVPDFDFLLCRLAPLSVVEYKGPSATLTWKHFDTAMAYAFHAKCKHDRIRLGDLALHFLYSYRQQDLLSQCRHNGLPFTEEEPGILRCDTLPMRIYLINLVELADQRPQDLITWLSARYRRFAPEGPLEGRAGALKRNVYYTVLQEIRSMLQQDQFRNLPDAAEAASAIKELHRRLFTSLAPEERWELLSSLPPEDRLKGLPPEDRLKGLPPEDRLKGLSPEELARLRALLNQ